MRLGRMLIGIVLVMILFDAGLHGLELFFGIVWPVFHGADWRTQYTIFWFVYWLAAAGIAALALKMD